MSGRRSGVGSTARLVLLASSLAACRSGLLEIDLPSGTSSLDGAGAADDRGIGVDGPAWSDDLAIAPAPDLLPACVVRPLEAASCGQLAEWAFDWRACHSACTRDSDCMLYTIYSFPPCLGDTCQFSETVAFQGVYVEALIKRWHDACGSLPGKCQCWMKGSTFCNRGRCDLR